MDNDSNGTVNDDELTEFDNNPLEWRRTISAPVIDDDPDDDDNNNEQRIQRVSRKLPELWSGII